MGGGNSPQIPQQSAAEQALQQQQAELIQFQKAAYLKNEKEQDLLKPILYKSLDITPKYDDKGTVIGFEEGALAARKRSVEGAFLDRTEASLRGDLPVNPALISDLDRQELTLRERLFRQLGPGWETSTPGIQALEEFQKNRTGILEGARRGDLTMAEGLGLARSNESSGRFGNLFQAPNAGIPGAAGAGNAAAGAGNAAALLQSNRLADYQGQLQGAQTDTNFWGGIFQGVGTLGGLALGSWMGRR